MKKLLSLFGIAATLLGIAAEAFGIAGGPLSIVRPYAFAGWILFGVSALFWAAAALWPTTKGAVAPSAPQHG